MRFAEQRRLLRPQRENPGDQRGVVVRILRADAASRPSTFPGADASSSRYVMNGSCDGMCSVNRHPPTPFRLRAAPRRRLGVSRQVRPAALSSASGTIKLPGVRGIEHVLRILLRELREFALQRLQPRALFRRQIRSGLAKILHRFLQKPAVNSGHPAGAGRFGKRLQPFPQRRIQAECSRRRRKPAEAWRCAPHAAAGESATDCRCVTFPHATFSSSVACSSARNVFSYVNVSRIARCNRVDRSLRPGQRGIDAGRHRFRLQR